MSKIVFENPPARTGGQKPRSRALVTTAAALRRAAGEWARIGLYRNAATSGSVANQIKRGKLAAFRPAGAFEAVSRTVDGQHRVYARYVGTDAAAGGES